MSPPGGRRITRRRALRDGLLGGAALPLALAGCGAGTPGSPGTGSTLRWTWTDPVGDGQLRRGPGEGLQHRTDLGRRARPTASLITLAQVTDAHVLDAGSPARVTFLDRLGSPFQSTFRPQEALTVQVLSGALRAVRALGPQLLIQGGDLIDNDQGNELEQALTTLRGGRVVPGSGHAGYLGVQSAANTDPFYYRPDVDAPRHPGLLQRAVQPLHAPGAGAPVLPVLGNHDVLVAGTALPTPGTRALALGHRALWSPPPGVSLPSNPGRRAGGSPDAPPDPGLIDGLLNHALSGPTVRVPADLTRRQLDFVEVVNRLGGVAPAGLASGGRLDYGFDAGPHVRLIVLDLVRREGGSEGVVTGGQLAFVGRELVRAGSRWIIVVCHQPLEDSIGGPALLARLDASPHVLAVLSGHIHRNRIRARPTAAGGYWMISTASLIDYPQQARAVRVLATQGGGAAIETWMLDHVYPGRLGSIARQLSYLDAQGGRPAGFAGTPSDRNVILHRRAPA